MHYRHIHSQANTSVMHLSISPATSILFNQTYQWKFAACPVHIPPHPPPAQVRYHNFWGSAFLARFIDIIHSPSLSVLYIYIYILVHNQIYVYMNMNIHHIDIYIYISYTTYLQYIFCIYSSGLDSLADRHSQLQPSFWHHQTQADRPNLTLENGVLFGVVEMLLMESQGCKTLVNIWIN